MKDGVLHETNKISLFGIIDVNPALISAYIVTAMLLLTALLIRLFALPRFM
jgi:F-type H+-transporting ATPase subunit a